VAASDNAFANHFENTAVELWVLAKRFELEGVVGKDDRAMYVAGRSDRWLRSKRKQAASARGAAPAAITMKMLTRQGHLVEEEA
jgi:ATP-dependent DNA ligase